MLIPCSGYFLEFVQAFCSEMGDLTSLWNSQGSQAPFHLREHNRYYAISNNLKSTEARARMLLRMKKDSSKKRNDEPEYNRMKSKGKCKEAFLPPSAGKLSKAQGVVMAKCIQEVSSGHGYIDMEWKIYINQARILEWVAISFSNGSSKPRNRTQVSCIAGRFL